MKLRVLLFASLLTAPVFAEDPEQTPQADGATTTPARTAAEHDAFAREVARLEAEGSKLDPSDAPSLTAQLLRTAMMLGAICFGAYLLLGKGVPRLLQLSPNARRSMMATPSRGMVEVIDRLPVGPKQTLLVVKVGGEQFLVGMSEQSLSLLTRIDPYADPAEPSHEVLGPEGFRGGEV